MAAMCYEPAGKPRVAFLVGAGTSQAVKVPGTGSITERTLAAPLPATWREGQAVALFLKVLDCQIRLFYQNTQQQTVRVPNYEDLYYVAGQLLDGIMADHDASGADNPAVEPLIERLVDHPDIRAALTEIKVTRDRAGIATLARLAMSRIEQVLTDALREIEPGLEESSAVSTAFQIFVDAILGDEQAVDIYTLNHDLVMETVLLSAPSLVSFAGGDRSWMDSRSAKEASAGGIRVCSTIRPPEFGCLNSMGRSTGGSPPGVLTRPGCSRPSLRCTQTVRPCPPNSGVLLALFSWWVDSTRW